jgi:hypothetical protein
MCGYVCIYMYVCVYLCMYVYVCMYVCIYVCMCVCIYTYMYVCMCVDMYVCMCGYVCIYMYVCLYVYVYMFVCMYICACMYVCICMYVCMYESMYLCTCCVRVCACVRSCALNQNDAFVLWIDVLWDMTPCISLLCPEAGGGSFLRNIRTYPHNYTASHSISQQSARAPSLLIFERALCPYFCHVSAAACLLLLLRSVSRSTFSSVSQYLCKLFGQIDCIVGLCAALCSLPAATKQTLNSNRPDTNDCMTPQVTLQAA